MSEMRRARRTASSLHVIGLHEIEETDGPLVGGKAAGLGTLARMGFNVPPGFCLTTSAHLGADDGRMSDDARAELVDAFTRLRASGVDRVAVRSSAVAEDTAEASFAGIYHTELGVDDVDGLLDAVEACVASADAAPVTTYRERLVSEMTPGMGVIVQALVPAEAAGVLFTVHPVTDDLTRAVVTSSWGLGESVASGQIHADTWVVERSTNDIVSFDLGTKESEIIVGAAGITTREVAPERRTRPSLRDRMVREIVKTGAALERAFRFPQDVEWAVAGDELFVLQTRPITSIQETYYTAELHRGLPAVSDEQRWERGSDISALPVSPLFFTDMAPFFQEHYVNVGRARNRPPVPGAAMRYHGAWTYQNLEVREWFHSQVPSCLKDPGWRPYLTGQLRKPTVLSLPLTARQYYEARNTEWLPELGRMRPEIESADIPRLLRLLDRIDEIRIERSLLAQVGIDHCTVLLMTLSGLLQSWLPDVDTGEAVASLTSGLPGTETHAENDLVWQIVTLARSSSEVTETIATGSSDALTESEVGRAVLARVSRMCELLPHRGPSDRDFRHDRWGDDPDLVLTQIRPYLRTSASVSPEAAHEQAAEHRFEVTTRLTDGIRRRYRLTGNPRVWMFQRILVNAQKHWVFRDNQRHSFDHILWNLRLAYRAIGRLLYAQNGLSAADSVFYLGRYEIADWAEGTLPLSELRYRADWRREWFAAAVKSPPAHALGRGAELHEAHANDSQSMFQGMGGSRGVAEGPARIVRSLSGLDMVEEGDILVTQSIDPAWTPVFPLLKGIVTEEGNILSHATVLSREYGIPAVLAVTDATSRIPDGSRLIIEGAKGTVSIIADGAQDRAREG